MDLSDVASLSTTVTGIGVAATIGILQVRLAKSQAIEVKRQGDFQEKMLTSQDSFMREQAEISKLNAQMVADQAAADYLRLHHDNRGLVPLAAMAEMYGGTQPFHRSLYVDFLRLSSSAQDAVFARLELVRPEKFSGTFWQHLSEVLRDAYVKRFPGDKAVFYEGAKYLERTFTVYGSEPIPEWDIALPGQVVALRPVPSGPMASVFGPKNVSTVSSKREYVDAFTDVLAAAFRGEESHPLQRMWGNLISTEANKEASYSECLLAGYFASYLGLDLYENLNEDSETEASTSYGSPGSWAGEVLETMEDVFLWSLFEIYTNLVLPGMKKERSKA